MQAEANQYILMHDGLIWKGYFCRGASMDYRVSSAAMFAPLRYRVQVLPLNYSPTSNQRLSQGSRRIILSLIQLGERPDPTASLPPDDLT
jgi:hypothetical protein